MGARVAKRLACIDGDILVYRTGFAGERSYVTALYKGHAVVQDAPNKTEARKLLAELGVPEDEVEWDTSIMLDQPSHVYHSLDQQVRAILKGAAAKDFQVYITGSGNFREKIAVTKPYKGNRADLRKPAYYDDLRARLISRWGAIEVSGAEADDLIAIQLTSNPLAVACSIDKDLRQVPGLHYNWLKEPAPVMVQQADADRWLFCQALAGDPTDNIQGIPGLGIKGAAKMVAETSTWWDAYGVAHAAYVQHCDDPVQGSKLFHEMLALVYLCRTNEELASAKQAASEGYPYVPTGPTPQAELPVPVVRKRNKGWRGYSRPQPRNWPRKNGAA